MTIRPLPFEAELVIVGDGADREQLELLARRNGPTPPVRFTGFIPYEEVVSAIHRRRRLCLSATGQARVERLESFEGARVHGLWQTDDSYADCLPSGSGG
jgi:glycosyltransferase involved in cell wall biosynthesis